MRGMMALAALALLLGAGSGGANAAEQQVRLGVEFTGCPSCVYIVKQTLARVVSQFEIFL